MKSLKFLMAPILAVGMITGIGVDHGHAEVSTVTVEEGDTLWSIAASQENVTIYDLYEWNPGIDPYHLQIGTEIIIDPGSDWYHTISAGDTFYSIATMYEDINLRDLYVLNPNVDPYNLQIGSKVRVKYDADYGNEYYTIKAGDTLYSISMEHPGVTLLDLYNLNPGINPYNLQIGTEIRLK
ncbi:LysM peptidoglycan-binding domain-containing protein [Oceanobacillus senegalensis]|uniref:LysM peptidoglycan-binding domain-containing protein n=1 Tax=Oceanobacillus senegalensis TaxID=1936063 RepID=UPI0015C4BA07|nr:LysM peptidoglycan-binding domain-containing protein [Oceanobacillus senegalensis]